MKHTLLRLLILLTLFATCTATFAQQNYRVLHTWKIGGEGGWDYLTVDPSAHVLYIARGPRIQAIDLKTGKLAGEITGFKSTHGLVIGEGGKVGYVSDGQGNAVRTVDLTTMKITGSIDAGQNPDGILYEPKTKRLFAFNGHSQNATVIDTKINKVVATIALGGKPEFPQTDGKGTVWVNIEDTNLIKRIDAATATVTATWSLDPCDGPSGLAFDGAHRRLFSVCSNKKMAVSDADGGKLVTTLDIGNSPDAAAYDSLRGVVFSSNGEGSLSIYTQQSADGYTLLQTLPTQSSARTCALDTSTGNLYLVAASFGPRPPSTPENPKPRPSMVPGSFVVLEVGR
jgi:YVTN family beta-propeller protein